MLDAVGVAVSLQGGADTGEGERLATVVELQPRQTQGLNLDGQRWFQIDRKLWRCLTRRQAQAQCFGTEFAEHHGAFEERERRHTQHRLQGFDAQAVAKLGPSSKISP